MTKSTKKKSKLNNKSNNSSKNKNSSIKKNKKTTPKTKISKTTKSKKNYSKQKEVKTQTSKFENKMRIIFLLVILHLSFFLVIGLSYAIISHTEFSSNNQLIAGELYLHYRNGETINFNNIIPSDTYDKNNYFEFSIEGKNTYDQDILYEIILNHGENIENKIRLGDKFLKFRLVEVADNIEKEIFTDQTYQNIQNITIHIDGISKNTTEEVKKIYRLYVRVDGVLIGNLESADYTSEEWSNVYTNINILVRSDTNTEIYIVNYHPNRLPSEYQEVEYIESSLKESILTNIIPKDNMGIYIKFLNQDLNNNTILLGSSDTNTNFFIGTNLNKLYYGFNETGETSKNLLDGINIVEMNYLNDKKLKLNNEEILSLNTLSETNVPISFFGLNQNGIIKLNSSFKLYELIISVDNIIKYNFIPCYRLSDNVIGLYDLVNNQFYSTNELNSFSKGNKKMISQNFPYDSSSQLMKNSFSNGQYAFLEWNTDIEGNGISYQENQVVTNIADKGEILDLYAVWSNKLKKEKIEIVDEKNATSTIDFINKTNFNTSISLSSNEIENTYVTLKVTLKNNSPYRYSYSKTNYTDLNLETNNDIEFNYIGLKEGDIIEIGESLSFNIKFQYADIVQIKNNTLNCNLNFIFKNLSGMKLNKLILLNSENQLEGEDGLYQYNNKYYFSGVNVNNYVWFNCKDGYDSGEGNCEKWRIVSIEKDGSVKIVKAQVLEKEAIESLELKNNFWNSNTSKWMTDTKVLPEGRILFDIKGRRPSNKDLENSYCMRDSNGCNAYSANSKMTGLYKNLNVDSDSLAKKYIDEVYYPEVLTPLAKGQIRKFTSNIGLIAPSLSLENILLSESSITSEVYVGLLNLSDYIYSNKTTSCWYDFSKCNNSSSNNWLTLPDTPYYLLNGKIVESDTQADKNAQIWTVKSNGLVSHDSNNEYFLRPVVVLNANVEALGIGTVDDCYIIVS